MPGLFGIGLVPLLIAATGLIAVFILHHLRSRPETRWVETLLFWDPMDQQLVASTLWSRRLRHKRTWLLLSAIVLMLAAALGADVFNRTASTRTVRAIVVDAGTDMTDAGTGKLLPALRSAAADAATDSGPVAVIVAGDQPRVLVALDEPPAIAGRRLADQAPSRTAPASALAMQLAGSIQGNRAGPIDWYTNQLSIPADVPPSIAQRVRRHYIAPATERRAITAIEFIPSADNPEEGSLRVNVARVPAGADQISVASNGAREITSPVQFQNGTTGQAIVDPLMADGRTVRITFGSADGIAESVDYTLPKCAPLRFFGEATATKPLRDVLTAIGQWVTDPRGAIAVIHSGDPIPAGCSGVIELTPAGKAVGQFRISSAPSGFTAGLGFEAAQITLDDATMAMGQPILLAGGKNIIALAPNNTPPILYMRESPIAEDAALPRLAAFPILVRRLCYSLNGEAKGSPVITSSRQVQDPLWRDSDESRLTPTPVNQVLPAASEASDHTQRAAAPVGLPSLDLVEMALLTAVILLLIEEFLLAKRKIV